jgi:hypothetical protein
MRRLGNEHGAPIVKCWQRLDSQTHNLLCAAGNQLDAGSAADQQRRRCPQMGQPQMHCLSAFVSREIKLERSRMGEHSGEFLYHGGEVFSAKPRMYILTPDDDRGHGAVHGTLNRLVRHAKPMFEFQRVLCMLCDKCYKFGSAT